MAYAGPFTLCCFPGIAVVESRDTTRHLVGGCSIDNDMVKAQHQVVPAGTGPDDGTPEERRPGKVKRMSAELLQEGVELLGRPARVIIVLDRIGELTVKGLVEDPFHLFK